MSSLRSLIVTGATGKQGGALISALVSQPSHPFTIYAVTRDTTSASAQRLGQQTNVKVIQGDFDNTAAIFRQVEKPWGLFAMTTGKDEERQGKALVQAAVDAGIRHIVFTATDRGGPRSDNDPTYVPHFATKFNVERDIKQRAEQSKGQFTWTFLRPVAFFDNLSPNFFGRAFVPMWRQNGLDRPLQQIGTKDIGRVAADAFLNAETEEYRNKSIGLAGDDISPREAARIFKEVTGEEMPASWNITGWLLKLMVKELRLMFQWFKEDDFAVDIKATRKRYPFIKDFRQWLEDESAWKKR